MGQFLHERTILRGTNFNLVYWNAIDLTSPIQDVDSETFVLTLCSKKFFEVKSEISFRTRVYLFLHTRDERCYTTQTILYFSANNKK